MHGPYIDRVCVCLVDLITCSKSLSLRGLSQCLSQLLLVNAPAHKLFCELPARGSAQQPRRHLAGQMGRVARFLRRGDSGVAGGTKCAHRGLCGGVSRHMHNSSDLRISYISRYLSLFRGCFRLSRCHVPPLCLSWCEAEAAAASAVESCKRAAAAKHPRSDRAAAAFPPEPPFKVRDLCRNVCKGSVLCP